MANDVKIRFRRWIPGGGFDSSGNAKQGKTHVSGIISVTSYAPGAEALSATDVGLSTIDYINLRVADETGDPNGSTQRRALFDKSVSQFYLVTFGEAGQSNEYASEATETIEFVAEGDSAHDVELLTT